MTKKEIYDIEQSNDGKVYLYPEGMFYKAYDRSAYLLCSCVRPFKVSARPLKGIDGPLLSVGFPMSSLEKFSSGAQVLENQSMGGGEDSPLSAIGPVRLCGVEGVFPAAFGR